MNDAPAQLDEFVLHLREVFFALRGLSEVLLADFDCTPAERSLLQELERTGPQTVPALAQTRAISRQAMQKSVDQLLERAWLATEENPRHQRSVLVAVTPLGHRQFLKMRARELELAATAPLPVSATELRQATKTLAALAPFFNALRAAQRPRNDGGRR